MIVAIRSVALVTAALTASSCAPPDNADDNSSNTKATFRIKNVLARNAGAPDDWAYIKSAALINPENNDTISAKATELKPGDNKNYELRLDSCEIRSAKICVVFTRVGGSSVAADACDTIKLQCEATYVCQSTVEIGYSKSYETTIIANGDGTSTASTTPTEEQRRTALFNCI